MKVYRALQVMRQTRNHLALVIEDGATIGLITLTDVLQRLLPEAARFWRADEETYILTAICTFLRLLARLAERSVQPLLEHLIEGTIGGAQIVARPFRWDEFGG